MVREESAQVSGPRSAGVFLQVLARPADLCKFLPHHGGMDTNGHLLLFCDRTVSFLQNECTPSQSKDTGGERHVKVGETTHSQIPSMFDHAVPNSSTIESNYQVTGKGSKERRIAIGNNCMRNLSYYLDKYRPDEEELAEWGSAGGITCSSPRRACR